ncbi:hypothetical protein IIW29_00600 [Candidatus Saccharibacteria bacterium]|nr:hypothetical protein [Candidatus Saccharibacteria bacterium]
MMEESDAEIKKHKKLNRGGVNLVILGIVSVLIAIATTSVSLAIYHNSGDIYLDRSRPGYLPDEEETLDDETDVEYKMEKSGRIDMETLEEYLDNLDTEVKAIDSYEKPFGAGALSNERLGIPTE